MAAAPLTIHLARRTDGAVVFELRRADGTSTWQKRRGPTADFFAIHDLTHYAVETILGFDRAFYGLVAEGWDLGDFGTPWPRGPLPPDALPAEVIVGCFDTARASRIPLTADACNASASSYFANAGLSCPVSVTDEAMNRVKERLSELVWRWHALPPGEKLSLPFPA
ncbi:MAG TPA: hypothetical protein VFI52_18520 [Gemmatimonadaceae bacterium]|nr:hypothetical protein [Gemmatimonadaceae bacterium]